jgi:phosphatidylglycerol:prolipoprotein diacylglycerol transferase
MHPILFTLGPFTVHTYGVLLVAGFLAATWAAVSAARRLPAELLAIDGDQLVDLACLALLGGIIGGRIVFVALHPEHFAQAPWNVLAIWHGGLVWYGGFFGGLIAGWWFIRAKRLDALRVSDQFVPFVALGHAIGRLGCYFNGCCYGKPTAAWCGVTFPGHPGPVWPTQLFEALGLCILFIALRRLQQPALLRRPGRVLGAYLAGYAVLRFAIEALRGDQAAWWAGLTLQQVISTGLLLAGAALILRPGRGGARGGTAARR